MARGNRGQMSGSQPPWPGFGQVPGGVNPWLGFAPGLNPASAGDGASVGNNAVPVPGAGSVLAICAGIFERLEAQAAVVELVGTVRDLVLEISVQNFTTKTTCGMTLRVRAETQAARVCHGVAGWLD